MSRRFVTIWFPHLMADWCTRRRPELKAKAFVLAAPDHGRMVVRAVNVLAATQGITQGMVVADARAFVHGLEVLDDRPELPERTLKALAEWCIRYTPITAVDLPDGLILDASGCAHLWGSEENYLKDITTRLNTIGYHVRIAMADTIGMAWAASRFGKDQTIVAPGDQLRAILPFPAEALRIDHAVVEKLHKLGLAKVGSIVYMQRAALRRRFGKHLTERLDQTLGNNAEFIEPVHPLAPYLERLPCLEPIVTAPGIELALQNLLGTLCKRLQQEGKGLRAAVFSCYRVDGKMQTIQIGTLRPSANPVHLFKLLQEKIDSIEPDLGIELFLLEAPKVEDAGPKQESIWSGSGKLEDSSVGELLDRIAGKLGPGSIQRFLPEENYWPEKSFKAALSLQEKPAAGWRTDKLRPLFLLGQPEAIQVTAPIPDYPPMLFIHRGKLHTIRKADGPERIERPWWEQRGEHRDYYTVEDEEGNRYWLFRAGHYDGDQPRNWYLHGYFA